AKTSQTQAQATMTVQGVNSLGYLEAQPLARDFASHQIKESSPSQSVTVAHRGDWPVKIKAIWASGASRVSENRCSSTLQANQVCGVFVQMRAAQPGEQKGYLVIEPEDTNSPIVTVSLSGIGLKGHLVFNQEALVFESGELGETRTLPVRLL